VTEPEAATDSPLTLAHRAFERGDFRQARQLARQVVAGSPDAATRAAAEALLDRLKIDPLILGLTIACALFFAVVIALTLYR
jgi:hypothetical protein